MDRYFGKTPYFHIRTMSLPLHVVLFGFPSQICASFLFLLPSSCLIPLCSDKPHSDGLAAANPLGRRRLPAEAPVRSPIIPSGACGGQSGAGTGFLPRPSVSAPQHHTTAALYSLMSSRAWTKGPLAAAGPQSLTLS
jgi:hypothetical protein